MCISFRATTDPAAGRAFGVLSIGRRTEIPFAGDEVEFLGQVARQIAIAIENALVYEEISALKDKLAQEKLYLEEEIRSEMGFEQIIGDSPALRNVLEMVETVAPVIRRFRCWARQGRERN